MSQILNQQATIKQKFVEMEENLLRLTTFIDESQNLRSRWTDRIAKINALVNNGKWSFAGVEIESEKVEALLSLKEIAEKQTNHYEQVLEEGNNILKAMQKRYLDLKKVFEKFSVYNSLNSLQTLSAANSSQPTLQSDKLELLIQESRYIAHTTEAFMELEVGKNMDATENSDSNQIEAMKDND